MEESENMVASGGTGLLIGTPTGGFHAAAPREAQRVLDSAKGDRLAACKEVINRLATNHCRRVVILAVALCLTPSTRGYASGSGAVAKRPGVHLQITTKAGLFTKASPDAIPGAYIVVFKDDVANVDGAVNNIAQQFHITARRQYKHAIKGFAANLSAAVVETLRNNPMVAYVEQDQVGHVDATQVTPTWGLDRIDQRPLPLDNSYTFHQTGALYPSGAGVDAYCIDTGIRKTHAEFGGRAVTGIDVITSGGPADDGHGHGTHTAGTIGGATHGVAKRVRLIAVRVFDNAGNGAISQWIEGIDWAASDHTTQPAVANMSFGARPVSPSLDDAVRGLIADGVTCCVSAGNAFSDASTQSPADVAEAITVAATDINDNFPFFSNYGAGVDLCAPGVDVISAWNTSDTATNPSTGTSMSSPHAAGVAALYLEVNPSGTPAEASSALVSHATIGVISGLTGARATTPNLLLNWLLCPGLPTSVAMNTSGRVRVLDRDAQMSGRQGSLNIPGVSSIDIWESTSATPTMFHFPANSTLLERLPGTLGPGNNDFEGVSGSEFYDVFYSDANGNATTSGSYLTIECRDDFAFPSGGGLNIAGVRLNIGTSSQWADFVASFKALGDNVIVGSEDYAVGSDLTNDSTMGSTTAGNPERLRLTLGFPASGPCPDPSGGTPVPAPAGNPLVFALMGLGLGLAGYWRMRATAESSSAGR